MGQGGVERGRRKKTAIDHQQRIVAGVKEMDIAATLEHLRDQRMNMVRTKQQYAMVLACVAEEVQAILKALPQP